ncbi:transposase, partial [candidate division KSB1 bacterium]
NGSQPTSVAFIKACATLNIDQAFTSYNNPKGNANTERVIRTLKEDCIWINEWGSLDKAKQTIEQWIHDYNHLYPHSALNYFSPVEFERQNTKQKAA